MLFEAINVSIKGWDLSSEQSTMVGCLNFEMWWWYSGFWFSLLDHNCIALSKSFKICTNLLTALSSLKVRFWLVKRKSLHGSWVLILSWWRGERAFISAPNTSGELITHWETLKLTVAHKSFPYFSFWFSLESLNVSMQQITANYFHWRDRLSLYIFKKVYIKFPTWFSVFCMSVSRQMAPSAHHTHSHRRAFPRENHLVLACSRSTYPETVSWGIRVCAWHLKWMVAPMWSNQNLVTAYIFSGLFCNNMGTFLCMKD